MSDSAMPRGNDMTGFLGLIERGGNRLPDPVFIFFWCIGAVAVISVLAEFGGVSALHPTLTDAEGNPAVVAAESLLSAANLQRLLVEMPATFAHFHPLGYVLVVMLGAGVAERSGLFAAAMSRAVARAPSALLTPAVALTGMVGNLAADAAYVVLIPLAGVIFAAAGRHPIAGIAAAFAGVSGGFSANLLPGQLDALLFGITEAAAETIQASWDANIAGNAYFIVGMTFVFLPVIWWVTDKVIEPKLRPLSDSDALEGAAAAVRDPDGAVSDDERRGLAHAGWVSLVIVLLWVYLTIGPGTPLIDEAAAPEARLNPLYR
ncbi:MAG: AbgT family transporter, partial [Pseudomonadota bacterium]